MSPRLRVSVIVVGSLIAGVFLCAAGGQGARVGLKGARPIIDAGRFPSIQAAIDALPAAGGLVRIPPGTFEITEPLVVGVSDAAIEGCGTATHIKNVNTQGKAALIIARPSCGASASPT